MSLKTAVKYTKIPFALSMSKGGRGFGMLQIGDCEEAVHASTSSARTTPSYFICAIKKPGGFTLIELVLVMVIMGVLSATALPRLNFSSHSAAGCVETVKASLRLTQKLAIAERAPAKLVTVASDCTVSVAGGETYPALTGVSVTNSGSVTFNGLGQPSVVAVRTFTITGGDVIRYVCLEPETGYVHEESASCG